jgi:hypothetical protein
MSQQQQQNGAPSSSTNHNGRNHPRHTSRMSYDQLLEESLSATGSFAKFMETDTAKEREALVVRARAMQSLPPGAVATAQLKPASKKRSGPSPLARELTPPPIVQAIDEANEDEKAWKLAAFRNKNKEYKHFAELIPEDLEQQPSPGAAKLARFTSPDKDIVDLIFEEDAKAIAAVEEIMMAEDEQEGTPLPDAPATFIRAPTPIAPPPPSEYISDADIQAYLDSRTLEPLAGVQNDVRLVRGGGPSEGVHYKSLIKRLEEWQIRLESYLILRGTLAPRDARAARACIECGGRDGERVDYSRYARHNKCSEGYFKHNNRGQQCRVQLPPPPPLSAAVTLSNCPTRGDSSSQQTCGNSQTKAISPIADDGSASKHKQPTEWTNTRRSSRTTRDPLLNK